MIVTRTVVLTAISALFLATPAFAAPGQKMLRIDSAPCDAEGPLDGYYDLAAFHSDDSYFPDDEAAAPDADKDDDSADDGDEDAAPDREGCATIMVTPYDFVIRPEDKSPEPVLLRRRRPTPRQRIA